MKIKYDEPKMFLEIIKLEDCIRTSGGKIEDLLGTDISGSNMTDIF